MKRIATLARRSFEHQDHAYVEGDRADLSVFDAAIHARKGDVWIVPTQYRWPGSAKDTPTPKPERRRYVRKDLRAQS